MYIRYVDDIVIFGESIEFLRSILGRLDDFLSKLRLKVHPLKIRFFETANGFEFLGHKVFATHFCATNKNIRHIRLNAHHATQSHNRGGVRLEVAKNRLFASIGFLSVGSNYKTTSELLARSVFVKPSSEAILQSGR